MGSPSQLEAEVYHMLYSLCGIRIKAAAKSLLAKHTYTNYYVIYHLKLIWVITDCALLLFANSKYLHQLLSLLNVWSIFFLLQSS